MICFPGGLHEQNDIYPLFEVIISFSGSLSYQPRAFILDASSEFGAAPQIDQPDLPDLEFSGDGLSLVKVSQGGGKAHPFAESLAQRRRELRSGEG
jgi:hypothetical protein